MTLMRRRWLILSTTLVGLVGALAYTYGVRPLYRSVATISINEGPANQLPGRLLANPARLLEVVEKESARLAGRELAGRVVDQASPVARRELSRGPLRVWYRRLVTGGPAEPASSEALANRVRAVAALRSRLLVQPSGQSGWIDVQIAALNPRAAADLANAVAEAYVAEVAIANEQALLESRTALDQQLEEKQEQLGEELDSVRTIGAARGDGRLAATKANLERQIQAFQEALTSSRTALVGRAETARAAAAEGSVATGPRVQEAEDRVIALEERQRVLLSNLGERHPEVIAVRERLTAARERLVTATERSEGAANAAYRLAMEEHRRIEAALAKAQADLADVEKRSFDLSMSQKKAEVKRASLEQMMQRQENAVSLVLRADIIRPATPSGRPLSPRRPDDILYGLMGGFLAGILLTWVLDHFDDSIQSPEDIKGVLGLPFLGVVPFVRGLNPRIGLALAEATTGFSDGLRVVRTNLIYGGSGSRRKVIVVTSASPADGKSTVASGLAALLRKTKARVLLIDGDLRRPSIHSLMGLPAVPGLSELLAEPSPVSLKVQTAEGEDFDVLTAGTPVTESAAGLGSETMRSLIDQARSAYDWIIIDSPPALNLPDAAVLGTLSDGVVIVCSGDRTPRQAIRSVADQLRAVEARLVGVVLNRVDMNRHAYYYGRHYATYYGVQERAAPKSMSDLTALSGSHER
jgi:capsular exopolysaccharide synthesis family protein